MKIFKSILFLLLSITLIYSCSESYDILPSEQPILITANNTTSLIDNTVILKATQQGEDVTAQTSFYINDELIEGNAYTSSIPGEYVAKAEYDNFFSEALIITYHDGSEINFKKRVLIEDYTGTWCGYCTRVAHAIEEVFSNTDNAVAVAIHRDSSNPNSGTYDPFNYDASELESTLDAAGYPKGFLNRKTLWTSPEPENVDQVLNLSQGENPKLGLAIDNEISGGNITIDVSVKKAKNFNQLKLVVYVLENGLIYPQQNYTNYYDAVNPVPDFEHNHVLRETLTSLMGDLIPEAEFENDVYTKSYSISVPANVENAEELEFVAFVIDEDGNAINVRKADKNTTQDFEQI
ncbi:Omp28-related outer membrane protein [Mesonia sp. MT50]|uniref:Omp28-related outer membrane protein n=1 Tax=Mesonia profundi TaxID=3070998 RepID=A0ABU1A2N2_9FLAO|nr:Omp28-related outer membrane protein [Mesonia profundi]MDQ7916946.1 Omp28-related outer membrane protein [Mesonia profundi]